MIRSYQVRQRGMSFVEVLVAAAIVSLVFGGLYGSVQSLLQVIQNSKAKAGANALAIEQLEYIRSLSYNDVGTVGGVPSGPVEPTSTTTLNGITYYGRVLVEYVDDEADGFGAADTNLILADYKRVKVEYSWAGVNATSSVSLVSSIVPVGIESTAGGGTIKVNVFDASAGPVLGAEVRFQNDMTTTTIDTTRYTNAEGVAYLAGAPAVANYEIWVSKSGYSEDGTYLATVSNPNPTTPPIAVTESAVSTMNFQIDLLSDLTINTVGLPTEDSFSDTFDTDTLVASYASTTRNASTVELVSASSTYVTTGSVTSTTTNPVSLDSWYALNFTADAATSTTLSVSVLYDNGSELVLIPDSDLPGNSAGFTTGGVDLRGLDVSTYHTLALVANLTTSDTNITPYLYDWTLDYIISQSAIANVPLSIHGDKTIGTDASAQPVYKYSATPSTDGTGTLALTDLEYDSYTVDLNTGAYQLVEACPASPLNLAPGASETMTLTLGTPSSAHVLVQVEDTLGDPIANATVNLQNTGIDETDTTSLCGQVYFGTGLFQANDYSLTVSASGYTTEVLTNVSVSATSTVTVTLGA